MRRLICKQRKATGKSFPVTTDFSCKQHGINYRLHSVVAPTFRKRAAFLSLLLRKTAARGLSTVPISNKHAAVSLLRSPARPYTSIYYHAPISLLYGFISCSLVQATFRTGVTGKPARSVLVPDVIHPCSYAQILSCDFDPLCPIRACALLRHSARHCTYTFATSVLSRPLETVTA